MRVLIADYNEKRRRHLADFIKARFKDCDVDELATHPPVPPMDTDVELLSKVKSRPYDLFIGHLGGNPSGYECLRPFKDNNPKGKVVLYTKTPDISLSKFNRLRLADRMFQRSGDDTRMFDNADEMFEMISEVMIEPSVIESNITPENLTLGQIIKSLKASHLWAIGAAIFALLSGVAVAAYNLGMAIAKVN